MISRRSRPRLSQRLSVRLPLCLALGLPFAAATLIVAPGTARAVGEQTGRVRGTVTNGSSGQTLEGVQVDATGPALIGGPLTTMTDAKGRFELQSLPPGEYALSFSYPGTVPAIRNVTVRQGEAVRLNVPYSLTAEAVDTISVVGGRQLTRPDSAQTGSVKEVTNLNKLPTSRNYQGITLQVPGVSGGAGGNPNIKGGTDSQNRILIDGVDVTDPVTNTFAQNLTFDSTQSIDVLTGGMDAEYNALGGVINVITRGGSDKFHLTASAQFNHQDLSSKGNFGPNLYEDQQPFNETPVGPTKAVQLSLNVGGPIVARKLWYAFTYEFDRTESSTVKSSPLGVPPYDIQHPARIYTGHVLRARLTYAPTPNHRLWLQVNADPAAIDNTARGNSRLGVAENHQAQGGLLSLLGWEWTGSERYTPGAQIGFFKSGLDIAPQGWAADFDKTGCNKAGLSDLNCVYDRNRARHINTFDNTTWYQGGSVQVDRRYRLQIEPSLRVRANLFGKHNLKAGIQAQFIRHTWDYRIPGNSIYQDRSMMALEAGLCDQANPGPNCYLRTDSMPFKTKENGRGIGFYVQDRWWTPMSWLTITPGLRFDLGYAEDWKGRKVSSLSGFGPRLGATADVTGDGRNILFAYYGRATEPVSLNTAGDVSSTEADIEKVSRWSQASTTWNPLYTSGGPDGVKVDPNAKMPHTDEITVGARREIVPSMVASVEYTYKRIANAWANIEVNRIWDPTGSRVVGYLDPNFAGQTVYLYTTPDDPRWCQGLVFATEGQPTPNVDLGASYTLSWTTLRETSSNPRVQQFYDSGFSTADLRHYLRMYGSYTLGHDWVFGGYFQYQSGTPTTKAYYNVEDADYLTIRRSPAGTVPGTPNDPTTIAQFRTQGFVQADLRISYNVLPQRWQGQSLQLIVDVFNVFNTRQITDINDEDNANFGKVSARQQPLRVQLGARYEY
jgi:hypothetical protein